MKLITLMEKQKRNKHRYNIYLDHEYSFSCNEELVVKLKLKMGSTIEEDHLSSIIEADNLKESFNRALNYLAIRSRTKQEVADYLKEKGYDDGAISQTILRLKDYQFIDDENYAINFVKNRSQSQLKGKRLIQQELTKKGVEEEIIEGGLLTYSPEEELDNAVKIGTKYFISKKNLPLNQIKQKLSNKLMIKGYTWEIISQCLQILERDLELIGLQESQQEIHYEEALKLGRKYFEKHSKKELNSAVLKKKVGSHLYQKGYSSDLISKVLDCL